MFYVFYFIVSIEEIDGVGDWLRKEWFKLNETLENQSDIINMQDMTISISMSKQIRKQMGIKKVFFG